MNAKPLPAAAVTAAADPAELSVWLRQLGDANPGASSQRFELLQRILVNHELAHRANKRDAERVSVTLSGLEQMGAAPDRDLVAVHEALLAFEGVAR